MRNKDSFNGNAYIGVLDNLKFDPTSELLVQWGFEKSKERKNNLI